MYKSLSIVRLTTSDFCANTITTMKEIHRGRITFISVLFNFQLLAQGSYDWNDHNSATEAIGWVGISKFALLLVFAVGVFIVINKAAKNRRNRIHRSHTSSSRSHSSELTKESGEFQKKNNDEDEMIKAARRADKNIRFWKK